MEDDEDDDKDEEDDKDDDDYCLMNEKRNCATSHPQHHSTLSNHPHTRITLTPSSCTLTRIVHLEDPHRRYRAYNFGLCLRLRNTLVGECLFEKIKLDRTALGPWSEQVHRSGQDGDTSVHTSSNQ